MILTLQTSTFTGYGGIPTYNRTMCRALNELRRDNATPVSRVLIANDQMVDVGRAAAGLPNLTLESFAGRRPKFVRRVFGAAMRDRIELLLIGHVNYAPLGLLMKRIQPGLRYGVMAHGVEVWPPLKGMKRRALQQADFVISVSAHTKERLCEANGVQPERVYILPNSIGWDGTVEPVASVSPAESIPSSPGGFNLLSVCRFHSGERYKGIESVIESLPSILARLGDLQYVVVGSGNDLERHRRLAAEKGLNGHVHFLGSVDEATLRRLYQECDVFVLPSAGEGFGIVYLEAMFYGKPVIAAESGAVSEVVSRDETGLLVEYGDAERLAEAILRLGEDASLRRKLGAAGRQRLQNDFMFRQFREKFQKIILQQLPLRAARAEEIDQPAIAGEAG